MLDYDDEAPRYDEERGGLARAKEAAAAVLRLVPASGVCVDLAGGTGIVSAELAAGGLEVLVVDLSHGMLRRAHERLPGRAIQARAESLPLLPASVEVVSITWLLHLLPDASPVIIEAARVLRSGGTFLTTVDKNAAHGKPRPDPTDGYELISELTAANGLSESGRTTFVGRGQDRGDGTEPVFTVVAFTKQ